MKILGFEIKRAATAQQRHKSFNALRAFEAAEFTRLTEGWRGTHGSIDSDIYTKLEPLRARSRWLSYNNDYARKFLQMVQTNVVGPSGFTLQARPEKPDGSIDRTDAKAIESAFWRWSRRGVCEVSGRYSFRDIERQVIRAVPREGEALLRRVFGFDNGFGYALQLIDIDRLDHNKNEVLRNGNIVKMGVEITPYGRPVNYWLRRRHPGDVFHGTFSISDYEIVPASEIIHLYVPERPEQTRGLVWMVSAILRLQHLGRYEEAALVAARVGAAKMGFWTTPDGQGDALADGKEADGTLITEAEPGTFGVGPKGASFATFDPTYPHEQFDKFVKACLRGIASGTGVAYNSLANDLENVNYSSIRQGVLEERDNWMALQDWYSGQFHSIIFEDWLRMALLSQQVTGPTGIPLPLSKIDKFKNVNWQGRRWEWVDPANDVEARRKLIEAGLTSRTRVAAERGDDIEDIIDDLKNENDLAKKAGVTISVASSKGKKPGEDDDDEGDDKNKNGANKVPPPKREPVIVNTVDARGSDAVAPPAPSVFVIRVDGLEKVSEAVAKQDEITREIATLLQRHAEQGAKLVENDSNVARALAAVSEDVKRGAQTMHDGLKDLAREVAKPRKALVDKDGNPLGSIAVDKLEG